MNVLIANPAFRRDMGNGLERFLPGGGIRFPWSMLKYQGKRIALNDDLLEKMAAAGCIGIKFGLDCADSEVLRTTNKPLKVSRVHNIVKQASRLGIKTHVTVVLDLAGESAHTPTVRW